MFLRKSTWLVTSLSPGGGDKMSRHTVAGGDIAELFARLAEIREKARVRTGNLFPMVVIQEAGLDGYWIHRALSNESWIESHIVDAASVAVSRKRRRAKTDRIDGEMLIRTLLAYKRGDPRVCSMLRVPAAEDEDRRRICRERKMLVRERTKHINRIKGLLFTQGIRGYEPARRDCRQRLEELQTGDGRELPRHVKAQIIRELDRLELLRAQIKTVEAERDTVLVVAKAVITADRADMPAPTSMLLSLKGIGPEFATVLYTECLFRHFDNRRQVASYAGLAASPWQSGSVNHEQGISKAGNPHLRTMLIELAWSWTRHQPDSALTHWFQERVTRDGGRRKKSTIVALARKLLVALWKYVKFGVVIEGAVIKSA